MNIYIYIPVCFVRRRFGNGARFSFPGKLERLDPRVFPLGDVKVDGINNLQGLISF